MKSTDPIIEEATRAPQVSQQVSAVWKVPGLLRTIQK